MLRKPFFRCDMCSSEIADVFLLLCTLLGVALQVAAAYRGYEGTFGMGELEGLVYITLLSFMCPFIQDYFSRIYH